MKPEITGLPNFWKIIFVLLALLAVILIIVKSRNWIRNHTGPKAAIMARLIDKHENSAPIHQGGISSQSMTVSFSFIFETSDDARMEFKVNAQMYAAHQINEEGKIIIQGERLIDFIS